MTISWLQHEQTAWQWVLFDYLRSAFKSWRNETVSCMTDDQVRRDETLILNGTFYHIIVWLAWPAGGCDYGAMPGRASMTKDGFQWRIFDPACPLENLLPEFASSSASASGDLSHIGNVMAVLAYKEHFVIYKQGADDLMSRWSTHVYSFKGKAWWEA